MLSLIVGTILGLSQTRIKRLLAYSTVSHVGFILLALSINSVESTQAFIFYLMQYSVSNLNGFFLLLAMGFSFYSYRNKQLQLKQLTDLDTSPVQLVSQMKGYFYINPFVALSFAITIFSFVGVPPFIGFFAKQMVLSAALDSGYTFIVLVAIVTSVISAVYYLTIIKQIFFSKPDYERFLLMDYITICGSITNTKNVLIQNVRFNTKSLVLSSFLSITISVLTLLITLFIFMPQQ